MQASQQGNLYASAFDSRASQLLIWFPHLLQYSSSHFNLAILLSPSFPGLFHTKKQGRLLSSLLVPTGSPWAKAIPALPRVTVIPVYIPCKWQGTSPHTRACCLHIHTNLTACAMRAFVRCPDNSIRDTHKINHKCILTQYIVLVNRIISIYCFCFCPGFITLR